MFWSNTEYFENIYFFFRTNAFLFFFFFQLMILFYKKQFDLFIVPFIVCIIDLHGYCFVFNFMRYILKCWEAWNNYCSWLIVMEEFWVDFGRIKVMKMVEAEGLVGELFLLFSSLVERESKISFFFYFFFLFFIFFFLFFSF